MLKRLLRATAYCLAGLVIAVAMTWVWLRSTDATAADFKSFKRGDIIFQTSSSSQSAAILLASKSAFTHMGIIDFEANGQIVVLEASATTRATPLQEWVKRGVGQRMAIYRMQQVKEEQLQSVVQAGRKNFGKRYDLFFYSSEEELYCSEFVHLAFKAGANISLGKFQKIQTLDLDNFAARKVIERRWQRYPLCSNGKAKDFKSCFMLIQEQELITPQSIAEDLKLVQIFSNYGPFERDLR